MKIVGVGLDIVEIERIRKSAQANRGFLPRVFTPEEIRYCASKKRKWQHFAARFAAKEAVWKALSPVGIGHQDISVDRRSSGRPVVRIRGKEAVDIRISLSHSDKYAAAVAIHIAR